MKRLEATDVIIRLCNAVLLREEPISLPDLSAKEWNKLLTIASEQGVLPIIAPLLTEVTFEEERSRLMLVEWIITAEQNASQYLGRLKTMQFMAKMLAKEGIDVLFMKGATLAQLYPKPEWRVFSDIDYYLFGESERGIELLKKHGIENTAYYHHHTQTSLNGVLLENHYDFVERVNHRSDIILDDALKALAEKEGHSLRATFLGEEITNAYVMTPTMNAIFLMRHMSAHFVSETIPLRMLYDWALFLKHDGKRVDWEKVVELYDKSGMTEFAGIVQQLVKEKLGMEIDGCPVSCRNDEKTSKLWYSIVSPPERDPYEKYTLKYYLFETKTFLKNRWKHNLVYPGESYVMLFFKYTWLGTKKMLGLLKLGAPANRI